MNHTQRIAHVARQRRYMTKAIVKEAVELYLQVLADEMASGEWVDIKDIGKVQVIQEEANAVLTSFAKDGERVQSRVTQRLRTRIRLYTKFKLICKKN